MNGERDVRMKIGLVYQNYPDQFAITPADLAAEAEARGFESLFFPEHSHIPASQASPYPGRSDGRLPEDFKHTLDPLTAASAAAANTRNLVVGTGVCLVAQRDSILTAKEVATIDVLSGGRFVFGVGYGWNAEEMKHHGVDPWRRGALTREKVLAMKALWEQEVASFADDYVSFDPSYSWPKPRQSPHPAVLLGGSPGPVLFRHVVEWADGRMPIGGWHLPESLPLLRSAAAQAGRDPASMQLTVYEPHADPSQLERYTLNGVSRVLLPLPPAPPSAVRSPSCARPIRASIQPLR